MKRLHFIQKSILAAAAIPPLLPIQKSSPIVHFIAIGESGGRILETLNKNNLTGRYTWIKSQHNHICRVPELSRIEIAHSYSIEYFTRERNVEMPKDYKHGIPDWNSFCRKADQTIILTQPTCYLSMYLAPLLAGFLAAAEFSFYTIGIMPFRFYSQREKDAAANTFQKLGQYPGKLTTVFSDSVRSGAKMNLAEAIDAVYQRTAEEAEFLVNRLNLV